MSIENNTFAGYEDWPKTLPDKNGDSRMICSFDKPRPTDAPGLWYHLALEMTKEGVLFCPRCGWKKNDNP